MSTPGNEFREAEYLGLGFLAVTSSEILNQLLDGQPVDEDDKHTLRRAEKFLRDVSSGAQIVTSGGVNSNVSSVDTVRKLAFSVEPLKLMQEQIRTAAVGEVFNSMASSIEDSLTGDISEAMSSNLILARDFFIQLNVFLMGLIDSDQRRTGIDGSLDAPSLAYG
ncbi:MAG: hypothetical protein ACC651_09655 [Candidatus Scalindua sp.]